MTRSPSDKRLFHRVQRTRQLAILQANASRGASVSRTHLPLDEGLPPGADVIAASYSNQVLMAPDGWGKTSLVSQVQAACDKNGWAQPLVIRCSGLNVRGASFRQAIREMLVGLLQSLECTDRKVAQVMGAEISALREALRGLHGRADVIARSVTRHKAGTTTDASSQTTEEGTSSSKERSRERTSETSSSFTKTLAAVTVGPFFAVAQMASAMITSKKSSRSSSSERVEVSRKSSSARSRASTESAALTEAYEENDDLKDHLDRLREDFRNLILRRQEQLQRPTTFLLFDDFDEVPLVAQPLVAEFFRLLTSSTGGYMKVFGRPYRLNLFLEDGAESAGLRPEQDVMAIPVADRVLEFEAWENWLQDRLDHLHELPSFAGGSKAHGHPQISREVLSHMALVSAGRPGLFFRLYARANELAWEAHDSKVRNELALDHADVDGALWTLQQVQVESLAGVIAEDPILRHLIHFLKFYADSGHYLLEVPRRELACSGEFRAAIERLVDQLVLTPVGIRADGQGQTRQVYLCDPRIFSADGTSAGVPWEDVRARVISQDWRGSGSKPTAVLVTPERMLDANSRRDEPPSSLPPGETSSSG